MSNLRKLQKPKMQFDHVRNLSPEEIVRLANHQDPDGSSGQYEIETRLPNFKFIFPKKSPDYLKLRDAFETGKIHLLKEDQETDPVFIKYMNVKATKTYHHISHGIDQQMQEELYVHFNEYGELSTNSEEVCRMGLIAALWSDRNACLSRHSKPLKVWTESVEEQARRGFSKSQGGSGKYFVDEPQEHQSADKELKSPRKVANG